MAAVGAGASYKAQDDMLRRQDENVAQGIRIQSARQREADQRVAQEVSNLENSSPEDMQRKATDAFMEQLRRTRNASRGEAAVGALSDAYTEDTAKSASDVDRYGANQAGIMGKINAAGLQRVAEGVSRSRAGSDLGLIGRASNADQFLTELRARNMRANPWLQAGGQILQGAASGMASGGYGASAKPQSVPRGGVYQYDAPVNQFGTRGLS